MLTYIELDGTRIQLIPNYRRQERRVLRVNEVLTEINLLERLNRNEFMPTFSKGYLYLYSIFKEDLDRKDLKTLCSFFAKARRP